MHMTTVATVGIHITTLSRVVVGVSNFSGFFCGSAREKPVLAS